MPVLGAEAVGEAHGIDDVDKEYAHLLALTLESATRGEDLLGEVARRIGACIARRRWRATVQRERLATGVAKPLALWLERRAAWAGDHAVERGAARAAEAGPFARLVLAVRAPHAWDSAVKIARPSRLPTTDCARGYAESRWSDKRLRRKSRARCTRALTASRPTRFWMNHGLAGFDMPSTS